MARGFAGRGDGGPCGGLEWIMKQRIRVVGIIRDGEGILKLKRNMGRMDTLPTWELPTGKIKYGEQPEEAMARAIDEYLGVGVKGVKLKDVVTFVALTGASQLSNLYIIYSPVELCGLISRPVMFDYFSTEGACDILSTISRERINNQNSFCYRSYIFDTTRDV